MTSPINQLISALKRKQWKQVKALVSQVDLNQADDNGDTPLLVAAQRGLKEMALLFLEAGALVDMANAIQSTPLFLAAFRGDVVMVNLLLDYGAGVNRVNQFGKTPLFEATVKGNIDVIKRLLQAGATLDAQDNQGNTPLLQAISCAGQREPCAQAALYLIEKGADIYHRGEYGLNPLMSAVMAGQAALVHHLLTVGAPPHQKTARGETAVVLACRSTHDNAEILNLLIKAGLSLNVKDQYGMPLLSLAAQAGNTRIIQVLGQAGLKPQKTDNQPPLMLAVQGRHLPVVKALLALGAPVNLGTDEGWTPLMEALARRQDAIAEALLVAGADVNAQTKPGYLGQVTVLMAALGCVDDLYFERSGPKKVNEARVKDLVARGADISLKNAQGKTALDYARNRRLTRLYRVLTPSH